MIFLIAARQLEGLSVVSPEENAGDNDGMPETEEQLDKEVLEEDVETEETEDLRSQTILKSEAEETNETLARENEALKYEVAKLKEELSSLASNDM